MTYVYADSTAVLGPLSFVAEPGAYDLCALHAERTSTPQGWDIIRLPFDGSGPAAEPAPSDDLMALADAVRAIGMREDEPLPPPTQQLVDPDTQGPVRHLRLVPTSE